MTNEETRTTRRSFLQTATLAGSAFMFVPRRILGATGDVPASDKLNIAGIGVGGRGFDVLREMESENIVALCDVDHQYAARAFERYPQARVYTDYRVMLEQQKDIDAVMIATPDHTHAVIALAAMQAGKHVYCEKPLTHDIYESRVLAKAARESKVCTQMGIQGHSSEGARLIYEWIADGAIGEVTEVDAWCTLSYYPPGHAYWSSGWLKKPDDTPAKPDKLDWNLWLGPAMDRPYHPAYHPSVWRCWWDFGNGMMGDRGAHTLDPVVWALNLDYPQSVEATSMGLNPDTHPLSAIVTFRFPARGNLPPVKLNWYEGTRAPRPEELEEGRRMGDSEGGIIFKGSKGKLMAGLYGSFMGIIPESKSKSYKRPPMTLPRVKGTHQSHWIENCKTGAKAGADFEYSALLTEICQLGNVAKRIDGKIIWDAENMKVTNLAEANQYVKYPRRTGWEL